MASPENELPADRRASPGKDQATGEAAGEYVEFDAGEPEVENTPDGGALVTIGDAVEAMGAEEDGFYTNLATVIPEDILDKIATGLLRDIEEDKGAREKRDKQYEEGLRRTGLGNDAPGGADFEGASRVVHPMLTEACIDYESRVIKELLPPSGPVRPKIIGTVTKEKSQRAARKVEYMNWQLTTQMPEFRPVLETTLTQVPLGGSQFINLWQDHRLKRPRCCFTPIDKVYVPFSAESFDSAHRRTIVHDLTAVGLRERIDQGMYRQIALGASSERPEQSQTQKANEKIEGKDDPGTNIDDDRQVYETMVIMEVSADMADVLDHEEAGQLYPYLWSIDTKTKKVLAVYRDWEKDDDTREPIQHLFEFPFIPWRGAFAIGFPQIIGGLSAAATGALRALLDSAHIANVQGGLILKGSSIGGQNRRANPTEYIEIEGGLEADDIRKRVMQYNTKEPSGVLFQLLGFLVDAAKGTVRSSLDEVGTEYNPNMPVGTAFLKTEEGLVVFSAIQGRVHAAFNKFLAGLHRLNRLYLPDSIKVDAEGKEILVRRKDFEGPMDIQPVADPTIFSEMQRLAQITAIQQRAAAVPQFYKGLEVEKRFLQLMRVPAPNELLVDTPEPHELNAVNENLALAMGKPVTAFPLQNHLAHLQVLLDFMKSPALGMNPIIAPKFLVPALAHANEHIAYYYVTAIHTAVSEAAGVDASELMSKDPKIKDRFDILLAQASATITPMIEKALEGVLPVIQAAAQAAQSLAPKPPMDPAMAALKAANDETARRGMKDKTDAQIAAMKESGNQQEHEMDNATKERINAADNVTALTIARERTEHGQAPGVRTGTGLASNPTP